MKILKQVWENQAKTELSAERVELETAMQMSQINGDMASMGSKISALEREGLKLIRQNNELVKKLESLSSQARKLDQDYNSLSLKGYKAKLAFEKAAKQLGLEYKSNVS